MQRIGILGGTFDPIHNGHLRLALEILSGLSLDQVRFIPAGRPPHRNMPVASAEERLAMINAAIAGQPEFVVDEREIRSSEPSYTIDSLVAMRREMPDASLNLIIGMDAFLGLPGWHCWQDLTSYANLVVAYRPGWQLQTSGELAGLLESRRVKDVAQLKRQAAGKIYLQPVTQLEISSSHLRELAGRGQSLRYLVPDAVYDIILKTACYTGAQE